MCWVFFCFQPLFPSSIPERFTPCAQAPLPPCLLRLGHPINNFIVLFLSLLPLVPVCDGWLFRLLEAGAPTEVGGGVGAGWAQVHMAGHWAVLKSDFSLAPPASAPLPVCIFPKCGRPLPSASLELSLVSRGQTCPAGGRHSLSFRAVFIFGLREVLNGPDTGLGDWWPSSTLSPQGPGLWSSSWWEVKRLFALLKCLGISSV